MSKSKIQRFWASRFNYKWWGFKAFVLEPSKEKDTAFPADFDPTLVTSGFPSMRKPNTCFSIAICLLLSLLFVLSTIGLYPSPYVFGLHDLVSRSFGLKGHSESTNPMSGTIESTATRWSRSSQVQFDNYSLILRGQRIFL